MNVMETIRSRYTVRQFAAKKVEPEILSEIMEAARLAPTASNQQCNRHIAVTDPSLIEQMVDNDKKTRRYSALCHFLTKKDTGSVLDKQGPSL